MGFAFAFAFAFALLDTNESPLRASTKGEGNRSLGVLLFCFMGHGKERNGNVGG
jgi:hypothetical protein